MSPFRSLLRLALAISLVPLALTALHADAVPAPPPSKVEVVQDTLHGVVVSDPYRWLEDQQSPATRAWVESQNNYTKSVLAPLTGRDKLHARLEQLLRIDAVRLPTVRSGRLFYERRLADQELYSLCMRDGAEGAEKVLVDPAPLSSDHSVSVNFLDVTRDGKLVAYAVRKGGQDEEAVKLLDVDSGKELSDQMPTGRYLSFALLPDRSGIYYTTYSDQGSRLMFHAMGTDAAKDQTIFGQGLTPEKIIGVTVSDGGRYVLLDVFHGSSDDRTDLYLMDRKTDTTPRPVTGDLEAGWIADFGGDKIYARTNWKAPHRRIMMIDPEHIEQASWKEIVPAGDDVIDGFALVGGQIVLNYLHNAVSLVKVVSPLGKLERTVAFPTLGNVGEVAGEWSGPDAYYTFQSYHVPPTIYRDAVATGKRTEWWRAKVPVNSAALEVKQVWYASKDGTKIPMFVLAKKGLALDGAAPTILTGYGGFNLSETPAFSAVAAMWAEMGGVYAVPSLRGGGEFGEAWHTAGMQDRKQNVFDDFTGAAQWLIANKYTKPEKLSIQGGSNGGLLVGAALTQHPELYQAVICRFPLLDMVRYHNFFVARFWVPEYGSSADAAQFKTLYAYSPYQHVKEGVKYPAVYLVSGDGDTRVAPLHARKMTAMLQARTAGGPVLLHYDVQEGHSGGGTAVSKRVDDATDELLFLTWQLNMTPDVSGISKK